VDGWNGIMHVSTYYIHTYIIYVYTYYIHTTGTDGAVHSACQSTSSVDAGRRKVGKDGDRGRAPGCP
jgi:hypothetical protein